MLMSWLRPLAMRRRWEVIAIGTAGIVITFAGVWISSRLPNSYGSVVRDLLPAPLMLFVYWQSGRFYVKENEWIQNALLRIDDRFLGRFLSHQAKPGYRPWVEESLEFAYLICYPVVPLGIGVLYAFGKQDYANRYWEAVLLSTYLCYVPLPFIQMLPPRMLIAEKEQIRQPGFLRIFNLRILRRASIQVNTFPSAHVTSTFAVALALLSVLPSVGVVFMIIALSIALGAVFGRYHYAADVVLGIIIALVVSECMVN
jgi:membrane-associated phospholipid phosphatase